MSLIKKVGIKFSIRNLLYNIIICNNIPYLSGLNFYKNPPCHNTLRHKQKYLKHYHHSPSLDMYNY